MALVLAGTYLNSFEAGLARSRLEDEGIMAFVMDADMGSLGLGAIVPIRLMVDGEDLDAALRILADPSD